MTWDVRAVLAAVCFGYPFVMAWYWMAGGLLFRYVRERHEPLPTLPPPLASHPLVSILVPCHNEENQAAETFGALSQIAYPNFEIVAINDGSRDRTGEILDELAAQIPQMRVVHLTSNQGKANALNAGALLAQGELMVCIDGDALLDAHAVTWFVRRMQSDGRLGALTGNPRIRNRGSLLGRLQVGEFSSIVGLIKRAQTVFGWIFSVSGVIVCFRKRAVHEAGWWSASTLTDDVELTWRLQLAGWHVEFEPQAVCWILMPETLRGLWRQRLRWSEGGTQTILMSLPKLVAEPVRHARGWPACINYLVSILWAYLICLGTLMWVVSRTGIPVIPFIPEFRILPEWAGLVLAVTYLLQALISLFLDRRFEKSLGRSFFWVVWYPLAFWSLQAITACVGLPHAIFRMRNPKGTWTSPDRGFA
ncbi:MAG TPA: poly-beta-1,6-N-acetyl-D-glucosamine synthase [Vicinamibacterales bacterium]|jgi:biofilm PGA synthesis N-glycosyltransferase PgaC